MKIGVPKEIKNREYRVAITPGGAADLIKEGHKIYIEKDAGLGSGFDNDSYKRAGADLIDDAPGLYNMAEFILKVKEPLEEEYKFIKERHILFTYFHFAASKTLTEAMLSSGAVCLAYETVETTSGLLPLLMPMSQVAGRLSVIEGAKYLLKSENGKGKFIGGIPGVEPARVLILGAGTVGYEAAKMASGLGANVAITDINPSRIQYVSDTLPGNVTPLYSSLSKIEELASQSDLIIGSVLIKGGKAPKLITEEMLTAIPDKSVLIDVAVDQGGCMESSRVTTHDHPVFEHKGKIHYGVANMPGAVPMTSTIGLTSVTLPYIKMIANLGWKKAVTSSQPLKKGLSIVNGKITYEQLAKDFNFIFHDPNDLIK